MSQPAPAHPYRAWNVPKSSKVSLPPSTSWWTDASLVQDRAAFMAKAEAESQARKARQSGPVLSDLLSSV